MRSEKLLPALLPGEPGWTPTDSEGLRAFLLTPTGQHFMRRLLYARPSIPSEGERRRIRQDEHTGFEGCIAEILDLAEPTPLTDEDRSAQTLNPINPGN
jgi:hypothetical protein